jgi:molecular chaperone HscA
VAGAARIRVTYTVDADGLLSVEAAEQLSGVKASVTVKPSYGLTDDEVANMLKASIEHARDDLEARRLREQQVEAQRSIEALRAALASDGDALLNAAERQAIEAALQRLVETAAGNNPGSIEQGIKALEEACGFYVQRRMDASVRRAMAGHSVEEFQ